MSKKIISIILLMTMLLSVVLTSCSSDEDSTTTTSTLKKSIYLTIYGIKDERTTDEAILAVQEKINGITETKYKTSIILKLFTEDEYDDAIAKAIEEIEIAEKEAAEAKEAAKQAAKLAKEAAKKLTADERKEKQAALRLYTKAEEDRLAKLAEEEAKLAEDGLFVEDEELEEAAQLDIFLIKGKEAYLNNINEGTLYNMNSDLNSYRKVSKFVNQVIMGAAKVMGTTYGIPLNKAIGTPQYYVINKALAEKYELVLEDYNQLVNLDDFLASVKANEGGFVPFVAPPTQIQSYDFYDDKLGDAIGVRNFELTESDFLGTEFVYTSDMFLSHVKRMADWRANGYFATGDFDYSSDNFAAAIIEGTEKDIIAILGDRSDEYMLVPYKKAKATSGEIFETVWAISSKSSNKTRAVEMLSALMTTPELQNLFAFGIENTHYVINADNTVTKLNDDWSLDYFNTFNTLIGYIPEELGADYQTLSKEQNTNLKSSAFLGFNYKYSDYQQMLIDVVDENIDDNIIYTLMNGDLNWQNTITNLLAKFNETISFDSIEDVEVPEDGGEGEPENGEGEPEDGEGEPEDGEGEPEDDEDKITVLAPDKALPALIDEMSQLFSQYKKYRFIADIKIDNEVTKKIITEESTEDVEENISDTQDAE